jgi:hypothetical protein
MLADVLEPTRGVEARTAWHFGPINGQPMCG